MDSGQKRGYESLEHIPQLDLLRAIAVTLVIISHWLPGSHVLNRYTPNGMLGVVIFFVLSGYLITRILLSLRVKSRQGLLLKGKAVRNFYVRRALRIVPLYFAVLGIVTALDVGSFRENWAWHWTYLSNIYFYFHPGDISGYHIWTLSVEEQFYLVWPLIILFMPRRYLVTAMVISHYSPYRARFQAYFQCA
jgi:peptidoglycan/LPS O-acetylase OafA/YrhL